MGDKIKQFLRRWENNALYKLAYRIYLHVKRFLKKNTEDNVPALSGQSAFFIILSIIPFLVFIFFLVAILLGEPKLDLEGQETFLPDAEASDKIAKYLSGFLLEIYYSQAHTIVISAIIALWSSGKGMYIITDGISRIYGLPIKHVWVFRRVFAMGYTFVMLVMLMLSLGIMSLNAMFENYLSSATEGIPLAAQVILGLRYVISTVIMTLFLTVVMKLYLWRRVKDKRYTKFRVLLPGMLFSAVAWSLLTWGFEIYATHFSSSIYGSLGIIPIAMLWVYFLMYLMLCGVQINYIYREQFYNFRISSLFKKREKKEPAAETDSPE